MNPLLRQLLTDPWFYLAVAAIVGVGRVAIQRIVRGAVDHQFALRIESHKADLQRLAEQERFELQRKLAASNLFLQKQHSAAAEVYSAVRVAHGFVGRLFGIQVELTLDDCNEVDLREVLERFEVLKGKQDELLGTWRLDRTKGVAAIQGHLRDLRAPHAESKMQAARNLMYLNEIYFSDATIKAFDDFVGVTNDWLARAMFPSERGERSKMPSRDKLNEALSRVQMALRTELSDPPLRLANLPVVAAVVTATDSVPKA